MVIVTRHAEKRLKERGGLSKKSAQRMADKAFEEGIKHSDTKGKLNKWVTKVYFTNTNATNIRLYGNMAYIFCGIYLVTVLQIPQGLMKDFKSMVKEEETNDE